MLQRPKSIGIFDSGIGGLTVVREVMKLLPHESVVYLGDTARVPYGNKSKRTVQKFSTENTLFLLERDVKLIIVACHTSSSFALDQLIRNFKQPFLGVTEPGVEAALEATHSGRIGVIGTKATVGSSAYPKAIARRCPEAKVIQQACPLFVPLAEEGWQADPVALEIARRYLKPLKSARVDTLILGCTHYPLLKGVIAKVMGPKVRLIDSAQQVARRAKSILEAPDAQPSGRRSAGPIYQFFVTDEPRHFQTLSRRFLGKQVGRVSRV